MMRYLPKLLVLIAVISVVGYTFHRVQTCNVIGLKSTVSVAGSAPSSGAMAPVDRVAPPGFGTLVYPDPQAEQSLHLGYSVQTAHPQRRNMSALPLPPNNALQTTLSLPTSGHRRLALTMSNTKCAYAVNIKAYRADQRTPLVAGQLDAFGKSPPLVINLPDGSYSGPLLVTLELADGAQNNWFCNIEFNWDDKQ
jgi:hypothetical protein